MQSRKGKRSETAMLRFILLLILILLAIVAVYFIGRSIENNANGKEIRGQLNDDTDTHVTYEGIEYTPKRSVSTVLLMGIDKTDEEQAANTSFRNQGQADFLMLLIMDSQNKTVTPLQIDRDTIAEITVLGVLGNEAGTRQAQICLSHGFGNGKEQSCEYTVKAVSSLLLGIKVDHYLALDMDHIADFNDAIGGVQVTLEDDLSALDPVMTAGTTLTLQGKQAEYYVRSRMGVGEGTNVSRMRRQSQYVTTASSVMQKKIMEDSEFSGKIFDLMNVYILTDMSRGSFINMCWNASGYETTDILSPQGEHAYGEDGFVEFHVNEADLAQMVIDLFYKPVT